MSFCGWFQLNWDSVSFQKGQDCDNYFSLSGIKKSNKWEKWCVVTGYKSLELNTPCKVGIEFKVRIKTEEFAGTWQVYALGGFFFYCLSSVELS